MATKPRYFFLPPKLETERKVGTITIYDYYEDYINQCKEVIDKEKDNIESSDSKLESHKKKITQSRKRLALAGIILSNYPEYRTEIYDDREQLKNDCLKKLNKLIDNNLRPVLYRCITYSNLLKTRHEQCKRILEFEEKAKITFEEYEDYVKVFYRIGVARCIIEGYAYKFSSPLGELMFNRWKRKHPKIRPWWSKTAVKKKEMREKGLKFTQKDIVTKLYTTITEIVLVSGRFFFKVRMLTCNASESRDKRSIYYMLNNCDTIEDICNYKDNNLRNKLIAAMIKDETIYLNYIRNADGDKKKDGEHRTKLKRLY